MKLKYLYLGLLSTLVMAGQTEAMMRMKQAPEMEQKLKEHEHHVISKLDTVTHGDVEHAAQHIQDILGPVTRGAVARGHGLPIVHGAVNAADIMPTVNERLEAVLVRLKAGIAANAAHPLIGLVATKTANTAAGNLVTGNGDNRDDDFNAAAAGNIEDFLAELGW